MVQAVKEICVFMLIAQAVLFFVPGGAYMKYVRILAGILVILRVTEPFINFFADEKTETEIQERLEGMFEKLEETKPLPEIEDRSMEIYQGIEEELKEKLASCENEYTVKAVTLDGEAGAVVVTVQKNREERAESDGEIWIPPVVLGGGQGKEGGADYEGTADFAELKRQYSDCIGVEPGNIVVKQAGGTAKR
ncbi:MAG: stage III sporulation protein AF [Lachnospiraceae bacterium]|nr:stage III sporulation protein AF [Lachnospiraceae bacterium]